MTRTCEDQQAAYFEGDPEAIDHAATCAVCGAERARLDELRATLATADTWAEPPAALQQRVVDATNVVSLAERRASRLRTLRTAVAACAAGIALTIGIGAALERDPGADARIALASTALAPGAGGEASLRETASGVEIRLDIHGLPRTTGGTYYQAWLTRRDGVQVPVGTFHTGRGQVVLWSGVPLDEYPSLSITLEAEDGDQRSSRRVVLRTAGD